MKRKLTAVLLTLCMVLGMLPMTALAAWYNGDTKIADTASVGSVISVDGVDYYVFDVVEGDTLTYYANADGTGAKGTLTWKADAEHTHNLTKVEAVAPTCGQDGTIEYYTCDGTDCAGKYFDAEGNELDAASIVVPATGEHIYENGACTVCGAKDPSVCGHASLTAHAAVDATCTVDGAEAYWECADCGTLFSDEAGTTQIDAVVIIPALGHDEANFTYTVNADDATQHDATCPVCGEVVLTEAHTFEGGVCTLCGAPDPTVIPDEVITVPETPDTNGKVEVTVDESQFTEEAAAAAVDTAITNASGDPGAEAVVTIPAKVQSGADAVKEVTVSIPGTLTAAVVNPDETVKEVAVAVETDLGTVSLPAETFAGKSNVTLTVSTNAKAEIEAAEAAADADETVTAEAIEAVKTAPIVSIDLMAGGVPLADKDNAPTAKIKIDIAVKVDVSYNNPWMFWVDHVNGAIKSLKKIAQVQNGRVTTTLDHLSDYVILDDKSAEPAGEYFPVKVEAPEGVTIALEGETDTNGYYKAAAVVTGTITVPAGKELESLTLDGTALTVTDGAFTFTMPGAATTLKATVKDAVIEIETLEPTVTKGDKIDTYVFNDLTKGTTYAYYIAKANEDGTETRVYSGSFVLDSASYTNSVQAGYIFRMWIIDGTPTAEQVWNGTAKGVVALYDSKPVEL